MEQRRFAAARRADERDETTGFHRQADAAQCRDGRLAGPVRLRQLIEEQERHTKVTSVSTCAVFGKRSNASTCAISYPASRKRRASRASVATSHDTYTTRGARAWTIPLAASFDIPV